MKQLTQDFNLLFQDLEAHIATATEQDLDANDLYRNMCPILETYGEAVADPMRRSDNDAELDENLLKAQLVIKKALDTLSPEDTCVVGTRIFVESPKSPLGKMAQQAVFAAVPSIPNRHFHDVRLKMMAEMPQYGGPTLKQKDYRSPQSVLC